MKNKERCKCPYCTQETDEKTIKLLGMCWECYENEVE